MAMDVDWILFDQNGTLLDPRAIGEPLPVENGAELALAALDDTVGQAMADTLSGGHRPFPEYLEHALRRRLELAGASLDGLEEGLSIASKPPPFPEAEDALDALAGAGFRLAVITNSAEDSAREALEGAGLLERLDGVVGADGPGAYKPDRRVYEHALSVLGADAGRCCLVAAHWWDILGASRAGLRTGWVARKERKLLGSVPDPDVSGEDLRAVARAIAA